MQKQYAGLSWQRVNAIIIKVKPVSQGMILIAELRITRIMCKCALGVFVHRNFARKSIQHNADQHNAQLYI
ncbi:hypothetical protein, partial [Motilimonas pumila]